MPVGLLQLSVAGQYRRFPRLLAGSDEIPDPEDRLLQSALFFVAGRYHFGSGFAVDAVVPAGWAGITSASASTEGIGGFGDIELGARYELGALWGVGGFLPSVTVRVGLGMPTGVRATTTSGMPNALRIGTGSLSIIAELGYTQFLHKMLALYVPLTFRTPLTTDSRGGQAGPVVGAGLVALVMPVDWLVLRAGLQYQYVGQFEEVIGPVVNSGGNFLTFEGAVLFHVLDQLTLSAGAGTPVFIDVNGEQLAERWSVSAAVAVSFGGDTHEHEHEDLPAPPTEGVQDLARGGETFDIETALVPNRVTVIDFWADWCHPCTHVDALLRRLASEHPELAVRRVEAPGVDDPVARDHLADDARLPQVWIYDASGRRVARLVGATEDEVREAVLAALR